MAPNDVERVLAFLQLAERLKCELRHSWLSSGRRESVAEHTLQMALMALAVHPHLEHPVDLDRSLRMILVHDLAEAEAGDVPCFETGPRREGKAAAERRAMAHVRELLGPDGAGPALEALWDEYEAGATAEARFARALDGLEVQLQHNLAPFETWTPVELGLVYTKMDGPSRHDAFLRALCERIKAAATAKMQAAGVDVEAVQRRAGDGR